MRLVDIDNPSLLRLLNRRIEGGEGMTVKEILETLETVQNADAKWEYREAGYSHVDNYVYKDWYCSKCNTHFPEINGVPKWDYCPACGAHMVRE